MCGHWIAESAGNVGVGMIDKKMDIARVVQYTDIFPERRGTLQEIGKLISGMNRSHLCTITANMSSRLVEQPFFDNRMNPDKEEFDYVRFFLSGKNQAFTQDVLNRFDHFRQNDVTKGGLNVEYVATTKAAVMSFQRHFFSIPPSSDNFSIQTEIDFFNALLLINQSVYEFVFDERKHEGEPYDLYLAHLFLANNYSNEDVDASDIYDAYRRQLVNSIEFFTYLCRDKKLKPIKERFYSHFRIGNWIDYIIPHIASLYWMKQKSGILVVQGKHITGRKARRVLKRSAIDSQEIIPFSDNLDYKVFRARPFIHLSNYKFAVTNISFVIEHIYNSVYFELKKFRKDAGFTSDDDFRRYLTTAFSQNYMLNRFLRRCSDGKESLILSGEECDQIFKTIKDKHIYPLDFYIRYPNSCILFEFKDTLLSAELKDERDPEKFFKEINKKFVVNQEGRPKGVAQLMNNAKAIQNGSFVFDKVAKDITIYPVLVVDNPVYTIRGMHTKLEYLMRDYCREKGIDTEHIRPLILVDVATFRLYADYFSSLGFPQVFEEYFNSIHIPPRPDYNSAVNSLMSFSEFMKDKMVGNMGMVFNQLLNQARPFFKKRPDPA